MKIKSDDSFYDSFNARFLTLEQVGNTFVASKEFLQISENKHSVLLGPRGSGKTTLMKMLTQPALNAWAPRQMKFQSVKKGMPFIAVYIPADLIWEKEVKVIEGKLTKYPEMSIRVINAIFTTNVLVSFVKTVKSYFDLHCTTDDRTLEVGLSKEMKKEWLLPELTFLSFAGIIKELQSRINEIYLFIDELDGNGDLEKSTVVFPRYYFLHYLKCLPPVCTLFDMCFNKRVETKWALCFDELEIVPSYIVKSLFQELRNVPGQFLFKLSTCPIQNITNVDLHGANQMDEYNVVTMWPSAISNSEIGKFIIDEDIITTDYQSFCSDLASFRFNRLLKKKFQIEERSAKISLEDLLGRFDYSNVLGDYVSKINGLTFKSQIKKGSRSDEFREGGLGWLAFRELAFVDKEFKQFLVSQSVDPDNPQPVSALQRTQVHRKLKQVVFNRIIFTKVRVGKGVVKRLVYRGRKNTTLFHGVKTLINIVDGNPRYLNGLVDELVEHVKLESGDRFRTRMIEFHIQSGEAYKVAERLLNKIRSIPVDTDKESLVFGNHGNSHLFDLVDRIGIFLQSQINVSKLDGEPYGSILVDGKSHQNSNLMELVSLGINWGAFIIVDGARGGRYDSLLGIRFRLAYLLAPYYKLPVRLYRPVSLSQCFEKSGSYQLSQITLNLDSNANN